MLVQKDGATKHAANVTINLPETKFAESVNSRNGAAVWPPRQFDAVRLFPEELRQVYGLCQQASDD